MQIDDEPFVLQEKVSITLSYRDGLVRHIPNVSAFLVVRRIPFNHPDRYMRPCSIHVAAGVSEECKKYLTTRLDERNLDPHQKGCITYAD